MTAQATVALEVRALNEAPVAAADVAHARSGSPALVDVLGNDTDPDDPISAGRLAVVAPSAGTAAVPGERYNTIGYVGQRRL